jgi:TATA-box binding protein (TBP) (component of TFIID and TFIIIB)
MRKTIVSIFLSVTLLLAISLILNGCKLKKKDYALSIKNMNNYSINDEERRITQVLYFTRDNIFNSDSIVSSINIVDDNDNSLKLKLNNIKKTGYTYKYNKEKYSSYVYDLTIPQISASMSFKNAKMVINSEDNKLEVEIGSFNIIYDENYDNKALMVNKLDGLCAYKPYQSLTKVNISLENKTNNNITIKSINMGNKIDLVLDSSNEELMFNNTNTIINKTVIGYMTIDLELYLSYKEKYVLKESYIEIVYNDTISDKTVIIDTFNFYDNGFKLPETDDLIYVKQFKV